MKIKNPVAFALPMFLGAGLALAVSACAEEAKTAQTADSTMTQPAPMPADHAPNDDNQYCNLLHIDHNFT